MNRLSFILFIIGIIAIGGGAAWYLVDTRNDAFGTVEPPAATSTPEVHEGLAIYSNGPYGFSVFYPESAEVEYAFDPQYHLGSLWRANALPDAAGSPIVAIIPYAITNEASYPRYFNAMVRVGASSDPLEMERCLKADETSGEAMLPDETIGGRTWKAFSFQSAGMMQYVVGVSYRTVYEDRCIALEKVRTGSNYREDPASAEDIPEDALLAAYANLDPIVESFSFAR